ncbi:MAG: type II toxin-antitoxin system HigB family toxin [Bacteroidia bacterium]
MKKSKGNAALNKSIDKLIKEIENSKWKSKEDVLKSNPKADCVHGDGFFFFNISIHRTMILIEFPTEENADDGVATIIWAGTHQEYEAKFRNNKDTIEKWLRGQSLI